MKPLRRITMFAIVLALACATSSAQKVAPKIQEQKTRQVWLRLRAGPILNGNIVRIDVDTADFTVKGILQSVPCDDLIGVMFVPPIPRPTPTPSPTPTPEPVIYPMSSGLRPTILHREKANYTAKAREEKVQGTVVLQAVFHEGGRITDITVVRELPHGLTAQAIGTAHMIRFVPAMKDGKRISVRGQLEFTFNLY